MMIEEFCRKLEILQSQYPADASDALEDGAKTMLKALKKDTPKGRAKHPHKLRSGWKMRMVENRAKGPKVEIRNTAPHYHLVERGVQNPKDPHGNPKPEWRDALNRHKGFLEKSVSEHMPTVKKGIEQEFFTKVRGHLG